MYKEIGKFVAIQRNKTKKTENAPEICSQHTRQSLQPTALYTYTQSSKRNYLQRKKWRPIK